jgi:hypothetical protein
VLEALQVQYNVHMVQKVLLAQIQFFQLLLLLEAEMVEVVINTHKLLAEQVVLAEEDVIVQAEKVEQEILPL